MTPVRLALVGFGKWGRNYVRAAKESGEAEVTYVVTRSGVRYGDPELGGALCVEHLGHAMLPDVEAVVFAGNPEHAPICAESILRSGRPILIEKPAGLSLADAERIARAEASSKAFVLVGHQHLFSAKMDWLLAGPGPYGGLENHERCAIYCDGTPHALEARWHGPRAHGFPAHWDYGPHAVSAILALRTRTPDRVHRVVIGEHSRTIRMEYDTPDGVIVDRAMVCDDEDWKTASVYMQTKCKTSFGSIECPELLYDGYDGSVEPPLTRQVRAFARAVRAGGTDDWRFGARWAVDVARVLEVGSPVT